MSEEIDIKTTKYRTKLYYCRQEVEELRKHALKQQEEIKRLRSALEPFDKVWRKREVVGQGTGAHIVIELSEVKFTDIRNASEAFSSSKT